MAKDVPEEVINNILFNYKGTYFASWVTSLQVVKDLEHMEIRESDVFLVTYPKSGTVWTQQILSLIFNEGQRNGTEQTENINRMPWIEYNVNNIDFNIRPSPRLFTTHLPYYLMPRDLRSKMPKIIYVCRNPKDVLVSFYHFYKMIPHLKEPFDWETFFNLYISGRVMGGSWFDHVSGWYTHKDDFNILFMTYEEMKKDLKPAVKKICKFVDINLDEEAIDLVVEKATFKKMKQDPFANYVFLPDEFADKQRGVFLRKGTVGDWKNIMTVAQNEMFDKVYKEKMGDLPIKFLWDLNEENAS
ncbi:amine sulfotransferase-like isoform X2 [Dendropsophus ebraccatus]|uniref:amine sulfotransferase-like isoform X2 n=1 Tax=Dendropsophus ebraccatus TaxID=150705 RepID=UPI00383222D0